MTVTGITPAFAAAPGLSPAGTSLQNSNPLLGGASPLDGSVPGAQGVAALGQQPAGQPGIVARLASAMKAAVAELRGRGASEEQVQRQVLAMQAQVGAGAPLAGAVAPVRRKVVVNPNSAAGKAELARRKAEDAQLAASAGAAGAVSAQLPANAMQLPGATVYSYDGNGNPAAAGLQGLPGQLQQQLGMTPTMGNASAFGQYEQLAAQAERSGPQVNATNQTNVSPNGTPLGLGVGIGAQVPGAPILTGSPLGTSPAVAAVTAPTSPGDAGAAVPGVGGSQSVQNRNVSDTASNNQGVAGWGGYGGYGDPTGGIATPYAPYGSSMTGAYAGAMGPEQQGGVRGFFSRLLG